MAENAAKRARTKNKLKAALIELCEETGYYNVTVWDIEKPLDVDVHDVMQISLLYHGHCLGDSVFRTPVRSKAVGTLKEFYFTSVTNAYPSTACYALRADAHGVEPQQDFL